MREDPFRQIDHHQGKHRDRVERLLFIDDLAHQLKASFFDVTHEQLRRATRISSPVKKKIIERDFDVPVVETFVDAEDIGARLDQLGFEHVTPYLHADDALCVIHLPSTMRNLPRYYATTIPPTNVYELSSEIYARCVDALWNTARSFCGKHGREIYRLNPPGEHKKGPDGFYYVWIIRLQHLEAISFHDPSDESLEEDF